MSRETGYQIRLDVVDGVASSGKRLILGEITGATPGIDPWVDRYAPAPPPARKLDARLAAADTALVVDMRDTTRVQQSYRLRYRPSDGGTVVLQWDSLALSHMGKQFTLRDTMGGDRFSLNMEQASSVRVDSGSALAGAAEIVTEGFVVGIEDRLAGTQQPEQYRLAQNYPNPFNPSTKIRYALPESVPVRLAVYDIRGRQVRTLINARQTAGQHAVTWDGKNMEGRQVSTGIYFYRLTAGEYTRMRKMLLVR